MKRLWGLLLIIPVMQASCARPGEPSIWRGIMLFGIPEAGSPAQREAFFTGLTDSLHLNVIMVRTFNHIDRVRYFLEDNNDLWVINQSIELAKISQGATPKNRDSVITAWAEQLYKFQRHLRFYLADEPKPAEFRSFGYVSQAIRRAIGEDKPRAHSVTAFVQPGSLVSDFARAVRPSELMIDPYFITNNMPHPSLINHDAWALRAGILPWGAPKVGYGWHLGYLQQNIDRALKDLIRPAATTVRDSAYAQRLLFVPQLHGEFHKSTGRYDKDTSFHNNLSLRPPAPSEIRLEYNLALAYGAKGILAFPYGFDAGYEKQEATFPGLVSGHPSLTDHASNFDRLFGKDSVWTGYREKWSEVAYQNSRLEELTDVLASMEWRAAKSWTMNQAWEQTTVASTGWTDDLVSTCSALPRSSLGPGVSLVEVCRLMDRNRQDIQYLAVVNRRCAPLDTVDLTLSFSRTATWKVQDIERQDRGWILQNAEPLRDTIEPGGARIYRVSRQS